MTISVLTPEMPTHDGAIQEHAETSANNLQTEASEVLILLTEKVASVLSALGSFRRPADVQKALGLDQTLSRQVFRVGSAVEPLAASSVIPSRTSLGRFLDAAKTRGIHPDKLEDVWKAYEKFEELVRTHAGDRNTFNTMLSSLNAEDEEWFLADNQHRRNAFRAMSHAIGIQCKTRVNLVIADQIEQGAAHEIAGLTGIIDLRFLQPKSSVCLHGNAINNPTSMNNAKSVARYEPLAISPLAGELLVEEFSSKPLPQLRVIEGTDKGESWREVVMDSPGLGNKGLSTLYFATRCRRVPDDGRLNFLCATVKPTEVLIFDLLIGPNVAGGAKPTGRAFIGKHGRFGEEISSLRGKFDPEFLGHGTRALATPEVPNYADIIHAVAAKLDRKFDDYLAYRIRVEFPFYLSTVAMELTSKR